MTTHTRFFSTILLVCTLVAPVSAAERLNAREVKNLVSGSEVWAGKRGTDKGSGSSSLAIAQSAIRSVRLVFSSDGGVQQTAMGVRSHYTTSGRWWVNKKGKLCLKWEDRDKKQCSFLVPTPSGGYELHGKGGKRRNLVFDKVTH